MCGLCELGFWQLNRAAQKETLIERYAQRSQQPVTDLATLLTQGNDVADLPLALQGSFLNQRNFLLDNRVINGQPGYFVITAFETQQGIVLIDRGWIPANGNRQQLPKIPAADSATITGIVYVPGTDAFTLKDDDFSHQQWPMLIQKIALEKMASLFDRPVAPFLLRLNKDTASSLVHVVPTQSITPERNYAYAFQWFAMAFAVLLLLLNGIYKKIKANASASIHLLEEKP